MPRWSVAVPALLIGLTIAAYWYRVLRMARKARKKTGRAANLVPPEALGRALRLLWAPAIAIWIINPLVIGLLANLPMAMKPLPLWPDPWISWIGTAIVLLGFIATRICWTRMGAAWRMGIDPQERNILIVSGAFAYVRHPIYALSCMMMIASAAAFPSPLLIAAAVVHVALLIWESHREEKHLLRVQGEPYQRYMERVGRFIPMSTRPYSDAPTAGATADSHL
jgi:protein-S-isoprenylcysteine O-methyltransferase Ste14